jgi:hypothetical protein
MGTGIRKNVNCSVAAVEADIEMIVRPKQANPGASLWICVPALPVMAKRDRLGPLPFFFNSKAVGIGRVAEANGDDLRV